MNEPRKVTSQEQLAELDDKERALEEEVESKSEWLPLWAIILVAALVLAFALFVGFIPIWWSKGINEDAGLFGDSFGFVNALLSGLAFAAVVVTLLLQRKELGLQRRELRLTLIESKRARLEYTRMAEAQEDSEKRLFLSAFVNALHTLNEVNKGIALAETAGLDEIREVALRSELRESLFQLFSKLKHELREMYGDIEDRQVGSSGWMLLQLVGICERMRESLRAHKGEDDYGYGRDAFDELLNIKSRLQELQEQMKPGMTEVLGSVYESVDAACNQVGGDHDIADVGVFWQRYQQAYERLLSLTRDYLLNS